MSFVEASQTEHEIGYCYGLQYASHFVKNSSHNKCNVFIVIIMKNVHFLTTPPFGD
jgi:hypothetical protein